MKKFMAFLLCCTLAGLCYVYAEVEAVKIGYTIRKQEESRTQALDRARALKYNIARLKAPQTLERRLLAQKILLNSPKQWQTLVLSGNGIKTAQRPPVLLKEPPSFFRFFVGTAQAEAKDN